jgi:serine/threonine-protein kinase HipA
MRKLRVLYNGWGEKWHLGTLADDGRGILFEYAPQAIERGLELSPMHQPLPRKGQAAASLVGKPYFDGLPGFIADALPDGWGRLLMDRALSRAGRNPRTVSVLERLAIVGNRAMGALSFEPADDDGLSAEVLELKTIAQQVIALQTETLQSVDLDFQLKHLMQLGGSPQGARPKVLANYDLNTQQLTSGSPSALVLTGDAKPWLIKFPAQGEHREVCAIEELYARAARQAGAEMPKSQFFDLDKKLAAFGVERFDRVVQTNGDVLRVPMLSLSAYFEVDHHLPALDYEAVLLATLQITGDQRELIKAFERCVLNVLLHNRDDHSRNFAFLMNPQGRWQLSPIFDLTYSFGPGGEHSTSVAGHGKDITRTHLLQVAKAGGISNKVADECINKAAEIVRSLSQLIKDVDIRRATASELVKSTQQRAEQLTKK